MTHVLQFYNPTASATVYGRRPKFFMAEYSATAEGENCAYGPTLILYFAMQKSWMTMQVTLDLSYTLLMLNL